MLLIFKYLSAAVPIVASISGVGIAYIIQKNSDNSEYVTLKKVENKKYKLHKESVFRSIDKNNYYKYIRLNDILEPYWSRSVVTHFIKNIIENLKTYKGQLKFEIKYENISEYIIKCIWSDDNFIHTQKVQYKLKI